MFGVFLDVPWADDSDNNNNVTFALAISAWISPFCYSPSICQNLEGVSNPLKVPGKRAIGLTCREGRKNAPSWMDPCTLTSMAFGLKCAGLAMVLRLSR